MSDDAQTTPAGFYPDPAGGPTRRWWDGKAWTETFEGRSSTAMVGSDGRPVQPPLDSGAKPNTSYIWVFAVLPLLSLAQLPLMDLGSLLRTSIEQPSNPLAIYTPGYSASMALGFLTYAAYVVLAYLDHRRLRRIGVVQPFHWAWTFLSSLVYAIGRAVVVKRRLGTGLAPLWLFIATTVIALAGAAVAFSNAVNEVIPLITG